MNRLKSSASEKKPRNDHVRGRETTWTPGENWLDNTAFGRPISPYDPAAHRRRQTRLVQTVGGYMTPRDHFGVGLKREE